MKGNQRRFREPLQRMVKAAETWGTNYFHTPVSVSTVQEPTCCADGALQTTIELHTAEPHPQRVSCLVTLEPNGTLSCFMPESEPPARTN